MTTLPDDPNRVLIFDTTLRDGEQSPGISLNTAEKLEIAQQLARLGVDIIEAGFPIASPGDFEAVAGDRPRGRRARSSAAWPAPTPPTSTAPGRPIRDSERPRIHIFLSTSDIHIEHQLQSTREDVKGLARAVGRPGQGARATTSSSRRWTRRAPTSSSPPRSSRSRSTRARPRSTSPTPSATRRPTSTPRFLTELYELVPDLRDVVALGPLPRRPRPGRRQLAGRRAGRRAAGRVHDQRHRRARRQRVAGGDRHAAAHARATTSGCTPARSRTEIAAHQPPGLAADRLPGPAQQGDRRPQRVRPRVRHPPGRRAEGARDLRDHGRARPSAWTPTRSCWASTPAAHALRQALEDLGYTIDGAELKQAFERFKEVADKQEAGHGDGPRGARHRRAARATSRATRWSGSTSRPPTAARRTRRSRSARPTDAVVEGSFTGDGPVDAIFRAINSATRIDARLREFRVDAVTGGQDALGEVSVVVELGAPEEAVKTDTPGVLTGRARHRRRPGRGDRHHRGGRDRLRPRARQRGAPRRRPRSPTPSSRQTP